MAKSEEKIEATPLRERRVAEGKCLTSLRGILVEGEPVTPLDFAGGQETFDILIEGGYIK